MYPVVSRAARVCNKETIVEGLKIPKDFQVIVPIHILHEDPKYWPEPHKFDPLR